MNYSSTDIFQGSRMIAAAAEGNASQGLSKKIKDMAALTEQVKKTYDAAVQDMHHQNIFSDKTLELEASFDKVSTFLKQNPKVLNQDQDIQKLVQEHVSLSSNVSNVYQKAIEALASQDNVKIESSFSEVESASSDLSNHIDLLGNKLAATVNEAGRTTVTSSSSQTVDIFITILILTNNAYKMAIAVGELQAKISASLNDMLGQLNDLLGLTNQLNKFYQDAGTYLAKLISPTPTPITWGQGGYTATVDGPSDLKPPVHKGDKISWLMIRNYVMPNFPQDKSPDVGIVVTGDGELAKQFGTEQANGQYTMNAKQYANAIKYVSQQMSGLMPADADTAYGSFFRDHQNDPNDSTNTNSFIQAIGKQTEMLQSKLSAVANTVSLSQQNAAQITTIFQQILNLQSGLISKM